MKKIETTSVSLRVSKADLALWRLALARQTILNDGARMPLSNFLVNILNHTLKGE